MKRTILILNLIAMSEVASAQNKAISNECLEKASYKIIQMMKKEEPQADVHLVKNQNDEVIGLTDSEDVYGNYDLTEILIEGAKATVIFHNNDAISFAIVDLGKQKKSCKIISVDMGQDDQD